VNAQPDQKTQNPTEAPQISVAILGGAGRMGMALARCASRDAGLRIGAVIEQAGHEAVGEDAGLVAGVGSTGIAITDDPGEIAKADVVIDFTFHTVVQEHARVASQHGKAMVIGTTGLNADESRAVCDASATIPIVWAPNMSLGVNLLFAMVEKAAQALGVDYDAEIVETHHRHKKDAPSGTAARLAECVAAGRKQDPVASAVYGRHGIVGERPAGQIGVHAVRAGDTVGDHTVIFATDGERVELSHRATSRDTFAVGALRAARWVVGRPPGLYDMKAVLGL
jgi:4-hydroxy-tetrahydrodipicolinate reductase